MAGLLYLCSGLGLAAYRMVRRSAMEARLARRDVPWLVAAIGCGGVIGPVLLMFGLSTTPASSASLLLNLESVFTVLLAWFVFKENSDRRIAIGMALITAGAFGISWIGRPELGVPWGALAITGACLAWAADNNFTRNVSGADPVQIAMLKGLGAGAVNTCLALSLGAKLPPAGSLAAVAVIGFFGYGVSLVLFVLALRHLGTARTGAYFSLAPFLGAALSLVWLRESFTARFIIAGLLMAAGVWLHLTERHEHQHAHDALEHEHLHHHDAHHQHTHAPNDPSGEPHSHRHRHEPMTHSHPQDEALAERILARDDFAYFGLIGSVSKRRQFERRLEARGTPASRFAAMTCPIGIDGISGKEPEVIAITVVAEMLQVRSRAVVAGTATATQTRWRRA
jgi:drug/metabolite transporter (DMT)-like permease